MQIVTHPTTRSMRPLGLSALIALLFTTGTFLATIGEATRAPSAEEERVPAGEITLPLDRYDALLRSIEQARTQRQQRTNDQQPIVAEISTAESHFSVNENGVVGKQSFIVLVGGEELRPVPLAISGLVTTTTVSPAGASLSLSKGVPVLLAERAGNYLATLETYFAFPEERSALRSVPLPPASAPVGSTTIEIDAELIWECPGATVVRDEISGATTDGAARRTLELVLPRDRPSVLQLRIPFASAEAERAVVRTTTATVLNVHRHGIGRSDLAVYEVARGAISTHQITLPRDLDPEQVFTDEGATSSERNDRTLLIYRARVLEGTGLVRLETPLQHGEPIDLTSVETTFEKRGHYLIVRAGLAADIAPENKDSWTRRDVSDLPMALRSAAGANVTAVWQLIEDTSPGRLNLQLMAEATDLGAVVRRRESTSLLTVDGSLVHRDVLLVVGRSSALEVTLPPGSEFWSMSLDGVASRPLESGGKFYVPLSLANDGTRTVEFVSVQAQALPADRRARFGMQLATLNVPVLEHHWRLLLPEGKQYRFASGSLRPNVGEGLGEGLDLGLGPGVIRGRVRSSSGDNLPGVTVTLHTANGTSFSVITNQNGWYAFRSVPAGRHRLRAQLDGFGIVDLVARVRSGRTALADMTLNQSDVETITVTSETPLLDERKVQAIFEQDAVEQGQQRYRKELGSLLGTKYDFNDGDESRATASYELLSAGQLAGVRPLPVDIPERGKVLLMTGVLPEGTVKVQLDIRNRR